MQFQENLTILSTFHTSLQNIRLERISSSVHAPRGKRKDGSLKLKNGRRIGDPKKDTYYRAVGTSAEQIRFGHLKTKC